MSDPGKYRTRKELDDARSNRDPLLVLSNYLKERGESDDDLDQFDHQAKEKVEHAFAMADAAPEPSTTSLWEDILR
jgi:pyruvate dehydrogenase E1 component alpha subunit